MAAVSVSRRRGVRRLDPYAAAWGGVIGAVALMVGSGLGLVTRFVIIGVTFVVAGAAAGLGAIFRAPLGGALTAVEVLYKEDLETGTRAAVLGGNALRVIEAVRG